CRWRTVGRGAESGCRSWLRLVANRPRKPPGDCGGPPGSLRGRSAFDSAKRLLRAGRALARTLLHHVRDEAIAAAPLKVALGVPPGAEGGDGNVVVVRAVQHGARALRGEAVQPVLVATPPLLGCVEPVGRDCAEGVVPPDDRAGFVGHPLEKLLRLRQE